MKRSVFFILTLIFTFTASQAMAAEKTWNFSIGASIMGGSMQIMAVPLSKLMTDKIPNVYASVQNSPGPQANVQLIEAGEMEVAFTSGPVAYEGLTGTGWAKGTKHEDFRTILVVFSSYVEVVAPNGKGFNYIRDLNGKRVHTYSPGSSPDIAMAAIADVLNLKWGEHNHMDTIPAVDLLRDGRLDAVSAAMGIPTPFIVDLQTTNDVRLLQLSPEDQQAVFAKYPYLAPAVIPANTYKNQPEPINTFAMWNFVIVHKDLPDDLVYQITKVALENLKEFEAVAALGKDFKAENIAFAVGKIHPGAAKYYKEIGIELPAGSVQ